MQVNLNAFGQLQQQQTLTVPCDRLVLPFLVNALPNLPNLQIAQELHPFVPVLLAAAVQELQGKASNTPGRVYLYNLMSLQGYDNMYFRSYLRELAELTKLTVIAMNRPTEVEQVIIESVNLYTAYLVSDHSLKNPYVTQAFHQIGQTVLLGEMQQNKTNFESFVARMRENVQRVRQMQMGGGMQQGGYAPNVQLAPAANAGLIAGDQNSIFNAGVPGRMVDVDTGRTTVRISSVPTRQQTPPAPPPIQRHTAGVVIQPTGQQRAGTRIPNTGTSRPVLPSMPVRAANAQPPIEINAAAAPNPEDSRVTTVADLDSGLWRPSAQFPALPAYDPNVAEVKLHVLASGVVQPLIGPKNNMDRKNHLEPLLITPAWVTVQQNAYLQRSDRSESDKDAHEHFTPQHLREEIYPGDAGNSVTFKENWLQAEAFMISRRPENPDKVMFVRRHGTVVDTMFASERIVQLVHALRESANPQQAASMLIQAVQENGKSQDLLEGRVLRRLGARLVDRINRFVSLEMSQRLGTIDNFTIDWPQLPGYFRSKLGQTAEDLLLMSHQRLMREALTVLSEDRAQALQERLFDRASLPVDGVDFLHLATNVVFGVTDLSTIELRASLPVDVQIEGDKQVNTYYSAMVTEANTALMYDLARRMTADEEGQSRFGGNASADLHLLRTRDGVVLEIARGAFNSDSLVAMRSNKIGE